MATLQELQTDLQKVNTAIGQLISGDRMTRFRIGSGTSIREYEYQSVTLAELETQRNRLSNEIAALSGGPSFRTSSAMRLTWAKQ